MAGLKIREAPTSPSAAGRGVVTLTEALSEKAARGELTPPELQSAVAVLLRDLLSREGPGGAVEHSQDDVPTRRHDAPPVLRGRGGPP